MKIYIYWDNEVETCTSKDYLNKKVTSFLYQNWHNIVKNINEADYVLVNTCWVTELVENVYLRRIRHFLNNFSTKKLIVFWCLWKISKKLHELKWIYKIINVKEESKFDEDFKKVISIKDIKWDFLYRDTKDEYVIQIWRWCIQNCTYCWTKKSIWYIKSLPIEDIKSNLLYALERWYKKIYLSSDDISSYWKDIWTDFSELFNVLCSIEWDFQINLDYAEASEFIKILDKMKHNLYRIKEVNFPIQSFSNRILKLMNRKYTVEEFVDFVKKLRKINNKLTVNSIIIYWYPTETFDEFLENLKWATIFNNTTSFLYSYREWTHKYLDNELLSKEEIIKRWNILLKMREKCPSNY